MVGDNLIEHSVLEWLVADAELLSGGRVCLINCVSCGRRFVGVSGLRRRDIVSLPKPNFMSPNSSALSLMPRVAIVGAGISGLICGRRLQDHGFTVTIFEKSPRPGGRAATRRVEPSLSFDHGAQYFTVRDPLFAEYVDEWVNLGIVAEWTGRIVDIDGPTVSPKTDQPVRYVGVPGMTAMAQHLAAEATVQFETRVNKIHRAEKSWTLTDSVERTHGPFDYVVMSLPAPQTSDLIRGLGLEDEVRAVPMTPCWAVLLAFEKRIELTWDGAFVQNSALVWVARNRSKPGREMSCDCWILHASPSWSAVHLEDDPQLVQEKLQAAFAQLMRVILPTPIHLAAHRWLYSATPLSLDRQALFDPSAGLMVCGDWLAGGRVEGAFRSGVAAAGSLIRHLGFGSAVE